MKRLLLALYLLLASLPACNVGPDYVRPAVPSPATYRGQVLEPARAASLADQRWWELFDDDTLKSLIRTALERNIDLRIAAARQLEAEAQLGVTRADQLPTLSAQLSAQGGKRLAGPERFDAKASYFAGASASWELDFWGKFRRASDAARADVLASEWGRRAAIQSLVSQVASSYFVLRALDQQLLITESALEARRQSLQLTERREQSGAGSLLDVRQAEELVQLADGDRINLARQIEQRENVLATLLGLEPRPIARGLPLQTQRLPPALPAGLPSSLLERRPDILAAEQQLVAANARLGVAQAQRLPSLALTGSGGFVSSALVALFTSPAAVLNAAGSLVQPLFDGGRLSSEAAAAEARTQQASLLYQSTVLTALREVSDALIGFRRSRELLSSRGSLLESAQQAQSLAELRYQGGSSSYLEVLDANSRRFDAEQALVQARLDALLSYVDVYRALGGGWQA